MHSKEVVCLARKKREDGLSIRRIAMDLNDRIHAEDKLRAEKEEK